MACGKSAVSGTPIRRRSNHSGEFAGVRACSRFPIGEMNGYHPEWSPFRDDPRGPFPCPLLPFYAAVNFARPAASQRGTPENLLATEQESGGRGRGTWDVGGGR